MKTIMTLAAMVVFGFCGMVLANEPVTPTAPQTPATQQPASLDAAIEKAKTDAANQVEAKVVSAVTAAVTPPVPQRTWSGFAYDAAATTGSAVKWAACQSARGVLNLDGAAAAGVGIPSTYVAESVFAGAAACDAASK